MASGLLQICHKSEKWQWRHNFPKWHHCQSFLTGFCFSCQVLLLVQVSCTYHLWFCSYDNFFIRDWPEIRKSVIPPYGFCPISGDWDQLGIANLARMSLLKCYWMLQNARVTAFTLSELLRKNQQRLKLPLASAPNQIRVNNVIKFRNCSKKWTPL